MREFELPPDRPATLAADLAVNDLGVEPRDLGRGIAAFQVADLDGSKRRLVVALRYRTAIVPLPDLTCDVSSL